MSRFVQPEATILRLSKGDTLTVRKRLNVGEQRAMFDHWLTPPNDQGKRFTNDLMVVPAQIAAYLIDWSLTNATGALVDVRDQPFDALVSILNALDPDDFREIRDAVDAHIDAQAAARAEEKKTRTGATESSATSTSRAVADGHSTM